ncbi:MAG: NAD-dependent epimerase/dehydratase family protein [Chitinispirillaceae bacterium]|nr:NAD-dependent epimerase/dehydratase family protein [Chitinispirillaceae bacterium]
MFSVRYLYSLFAMKNILITGGAGFIGSNLAVALRADGHAVTCLDNLSRRGSELLLRRILYHGCAFVHGDIRCADDLGKLKGDFDAMVEASAEPSVLVGTRGSDARFMIDNNLSGSINCFEFARERRVPVIFLSTSRVYPYTAINRLRFRETASRFEFAGRGAGVSRKGIATSFPLRGFRSLYGAAKLASEYLLQEYSGQYGLPAVIDRFGVIAGPWQLGRADQGVFTFWLCRHFYKKELRYIGFGGGGKQVRDLLHVDDLVRLVKKQIGAVRRFRGEVFNAGGSAFSSLSLREATALCRELTGNTVRISPVRQDRPADVKWYVTDNGDTCRTFGWKPEKKPREILADTYAWLYAHSAEFSSLFSKDDA